MKCQISIYPKLEIDQLKTNVDPASEDLKIGTEAIGFVDVEATLVGASSSIDEGGTIHYDPSKASTILNRLGIRDMEQQFTIIDQLHELEGRSDSYKPEGVR